MSSVAHILSEALAHDIVLYLKDDQLAFAASGKEFPAQLREKITANKAGIIEYLRRLPSGAQTAADSPVLPEQNARLTRDEVQMLLSALGDAGVQLYLEDGKLKTRSKPGAITDAMATQIRHHKQALVDHLAATQTHATPEPAAATVPGSEHELSFAQQRLWFLDHFESASSYNMPVALRLKGKLDCLALQHSLVEIVQRHAVLRSVYRKSRGRPVQVIQAAATIQMPVIDLTELPSADQIAEISRLARAEMERPFDLARDSMLRLLLVRLSAQEHVLYATLHHIAADGWSLGLLVKELVALYDAFIRGQPSPLPALSYQYVDYARWQRKHCKGEKAERELDFWRNALAGIPPLHNLPTDKPRPVQQCAAGGALHRELDAGTLAALQRLAQQHKATFFMVLHAAFALLLGRWSCERDVVVGTPVAGRLLPMTEPLIGCFVNTLALRTRLPESASFEELLQQSRVETLRAYEHQDTPFETLVEALNPQRSLSHTPLFQVMFALQNYELGRLALPGLAVEVLPTEYALAKFDLAVMAVERQDGLAMTWVYAESLFENETIQSMVSSYVALLKAIAVAPQGGIFDLPLLGEQEREATLALYRNSGEHRMVLDGQGQLQPVGALGQLHEPEKEACSRNMPTAALAEDVRPELVRLTSDGHIEPVVRQQPIERASASIATSKPVAPADALERQLHEIWCLVLGDQQLGIHDNFFDAGGSSMQSILLQQEIQARLGREVSVTDLFTYPTIAALAGFLRGDESLPDLREGVERAAGRDDIAIIGMAGRFPDAADVDAFWENIKHGVESLRHFSDEQLRQSGVSEVLLSHSSYVKCGVLIDGIEDFDAGFFGFTPRDADVTDPQQRLLLECAVEALEHAGYGDDSQPRAVAVHVGIGESRYLFDHLLPQAAQLEAALVAGMYGNRPDFVATRLSYRLNLCGPSLTVGTACSTSLVAVHNACLSLFNGECDLALAGGSSLLQISPQGYLYQEGSISSPDGHCRAFDRDAKGTRGGGGAGVVVLKRLQQALADGDTIHAVIKGSAVNNDGADKVGYTAPSVLGQAKVIRAAQRAAGVVSDSIQYVEAHGTGTELGDPIEVKALARAFDTPRRQFCAITSVKPNIGHLDVAAGVAGLIKTVQALKHRQLPPSINYASPNPQIDFANSPFYVNTQLRAWESTGPRRAGVSSFGIGGTNAHVVVEEAPTVVAGESHRPQQLLVLSARSERALQAVSDRLAQRLQHGEACLSDVAYTLQVGRARHGYRRVLVSGSVEEAVRQLKQPYTAAKGDAASMVWMFTGQGSQHAQMGRGLYESEPSFRQHWDACAALCELAQDEERLGQTAYAQPALFALEYSLARMLQDWGLQPAVMIGHSLGEFVAACLAGVLSLEDALKLVVARGRLMQGMAPGRMLAMELGEAQAHDVLEGSGCSLAAVNSARHCVAAGTPEAIDALQGRLAQQGVACRVLHTSHAFHSVLMDPMLEEWRAVVKTVRLGAPQLAYVSNVTGGYVRAEDATDVEYWVSHLRQGVRFADGLETVLGEGGRRVLLELGPGRVLSGLARHHARAREHVIVAALRHGQDASGDAQVLQQALGQVWQA
ncbi:MAG: condensation domain-containing protein, partial [Dyella sp.]|uniref:condensation domain-containing protein n=1 Tax=Dyella sp. TaxID=1869338 RepID=UPI003F7DAF01